MVFRLGYRFVCLLVINIPLLCMSLLCLGYEWVDMN